MLRLFGYFYSKTQYLRPNLCETIFFVCLNELFIMSFCFVWYMYNVCFKWLLLFIPYKCHKHFLTFFVCSLLYYKPSIRKTVVVYLSVYTPLILYNESDVYLTRYSYPPREVKCLTLKFFWISKYICSMDGT